MKKPTFSIPYCCVLSTLKKCFLTFSFITISISKGFQNIKNFLFENTFILKNRLTLKPVFMVLVFFLSLTSIAQTLKPFAIRKNVDLKGKMLVIGNNILGKDNNTLNDNSVNENISMQYIDIDGDSSTFSSSSAELVAPTQKNGNASTCYRVAYAALYWSAMLQGGSRTDINKVKLKLPGASTYNNITGSVIYDAISTPQVPDNNTPYACYADVTSLLATLPSLAGNYTVADVISSTGKNGSTGLAAGWTLFVIYEDPTFTMKSFTSFDGFAALYDGHFETIPVTGFRTPLSGPVDLQFAYAALEGDKTSKSKLEFDGKEVTTPLRGPANSFFNSTIENSWGVSTPRNPSSSNTLGYDTGMLEIKGANPAYIKNNQTSTSFMLQGPSGQADPLFGFMGSYAVDIIAPDIKLTKLVKNSTGTDIGGTDVTLGDYLYYEIKYQNIGNDNVTGMTITDVLPKNIIFNYPGDLDLSDAGGVTVQSYDPITRTIIFNVPDTSVIVGKPLPYTIRIKAQIVPDCNMLTDACSNKIQNQATAIYKGVINTNTFNTSSFSSTGCNFGVATPTNFLVKIENCKFTQNVVLCNNSVLLTGPNGYDNYVWSRTLGGSSIGTGQTYTATQTGVYYVRATSLSNCLPIDQEITVVPFGNTVTNPVIPYAQAPYAGSVTTCTINGKLLPNLFLCGANDFRDIKTGITDATSIIWEKLNENGTCPAATSTTICANESASCSWSQVGTGPDYKANTAGQFRLIINYTGGCFSVFYFNVFQNLLNPTVVSKDITCNTKGEITVNGIPASGYEFSLDNGGTGTYQPSNIFTDVSVGLHNVYIRQVGVTNACLFKVLNVQILNRIYEVKVNATQPLCNGGKGSVTIQANNVLPQYYFSIYQGATKVDAVGPQIANDHTFSSLNPGTYTVRVWTDDGCDYSEDIEIINPAPLTATAALTKPLTCTDGEITVYPVGGTAPYIYYINSTTDFQNTPQVIVTNPLPAGGIYNITVEDSNNCTTTTSATVVATPAPVYSISTTNVLCYGDASGTIQFNVTSNIGNYTLSYSIDGGTTYSNNPIFSGLSADIVYTPKIRYTLNDIDYCYDTKPTVTLTGPSTALTASAGVSELAGCGPNGEGKIRITNPQGGTPFPAPNYYLYSFDDQVTWIPSNEAYKAPGTYTVYIKDANGCIYAMRNIIIEQEPVPPTIDLSTPVFNCDGTANRTVTVTNPDNTSYQYGYLLDGTANTNNPAYVFVNVPSGSHTISVTYKLLKVPTYSNLLKEDFGQDTFAYTATASPDASSPGINSAFCWERQIEATKCNGNKLFANGEYTVTSNLRNNPYSGWWSPVDHTAGSVIGRFLAVDAGTAIPNNAVLYRKTIKDIIPNQPIQVRFFATNLLKTGNTQPDASLTVELQDSSGAALSSSSTGRIPKTNGWVEYNKTIDPGNNTTLDFVLRLEVAQVNGIDFAVDDLEVYQLPKSCITQVDFPFEVPTGKAFSGSVTGSKDITCAGAINGEITIAAQNFDPVYGFDYSIDGGTTWTNSKTSPVTITGLAANTYTPQLRYSAAGACPLTLTPVTIKEPTALSVTADVTTLATCTTGATITASAGGGTPGYEYELRAADGTTVVAGFGFSSNTVFTNVPTGNYTVFAKDANGCITSVGAGVNVVAPPALTASLDPSTDYCYTTANPATLVVNVTGGVGPFTYKLDSNAAVSSDLTTFSFTNVGPGTHTIEVMDSNNCTTTISSIVIASPLTFNVSLLQDLTCLADASIGNPIINGGNGAPYTYTVSYNGGGSTAVSSFPYTATAAGTYVFTVTDSKGCPATSNAITVTSKTTPTFTFAKTDSTCNNVDDGTITVTAADGFTSNYTYAIKLSTASTFTTQSTNVFTGLATGTYDVKVIDSKGCESAVSQITIANPSPITANATATSFSCSVTNTKQSATISVAPSGGTGSYTYSYNNGTSFGPNNSLTVDDNGTTQTFQIIVKDTNGCLSPMQTITLSPLNPPTDLNFTPSGVITCSTTTIGVQLSTINGVGTLTYTITSPAAATSNTTGATSGNFTGLTSGTYVFRVTDANGCYYSESYEVKAVTPIAAVATKLTDVACFADFTGSIKYTVSGFSGTYSYKVNGGTDVTGQTATTFTLPSLGANTYNVVFTDETTNCTASTSTIITQPTNPLSATFTKINANCNVATSAVTVTATGGTSPYTYAFVQDGLDPSSSYVGSNVGNLNPATNANWDLWVKDANGCTFKLDVTVTKDLVPTVTAAVTNQCSATGSTFQIKAVGADGVAPYTYTINTGVAPSPADTFTVAAGTYTITVTDANGCTNTTTVTVNEALTASAIVTKDITCSTPKEATIKVDVLGGKAPFGYRVNIGGAGFSGSPIGFSGTSFIYSETGVFVGKTYQFEITDANGIPCTTFTNTVTTNTPTPVAATETHVDPTCNGFTDGSIKLTATAGVAPFTYSIIGVNGGAFSSSNVFGGLAAGSYNYTVRDNKGCDATGTATLVDPAPVVGVIKVNDIQCNTNVPGSIEITSITGGIAPFTFTLYDSNYNVLDVKNTSLTAYKFPNSLDFGDYYVTIVDSKGCEFKSPKLRINTAPYLKLDLVDVTGDCLTGATVNVKLDPSFTSVPDYIYSIYGDSTSAQPLTSSTTAQFPGLKFGQTYYFQVEDANGCISILEVPIAPKSLIKIDPITITGVTCKTLPLTKNGSIDFTISGYTLPPDPLAVTQLHLEVLDQLSNTSLPTPIVKIVSVAGVSSIDESFSGLAAGSYTLQVVEMDGTKCSASIPFEIKQPTQELFSSVASVVNANCNSGALATLTTTGGTGPYTYAYAVAPNVPSTFASGNVLTLNPGPSGTDLNWNIIVKDANGCTFPLSTTIAIDPSPVIALSVVDKCVAEGTFGIKVDQVTAGTGAYTISVDGSTFTSIVGLPYTVTGLNSGPHIIAIKDANGCTDTKSITIDKPLVATPAITALPTCADNDGVITMSGTGGTGTYSYSISPIAGIIAGNVISGLPAGTYTVTMKDTSSPSNCTTTAVVTLAAPIPVTFTTATTPVLCVGDSNGTITVTLGAGNNNPNYTYEIISGPQLAAVQPSNIFTGLPSGTYTVRVNSGRGCSTDDPNVVVAPAIPLTASASFPPNTTCSVATVITVSASGGKQTGIGTGYLYNFNGLGYTSDNTFTVNNSTSIQTITYTVKDANGCETVQQSIDVGPLNKPTDLSFVVSTPPICPTSTSGITVTASNGVGALKFEIIEFNGAPTALYPAINTPDFTVSAVFSGLVPGDYLFQVTDENGCTYQELYTVKGVINITVTTNASTDVTCFGSANGTAIFNITNFAGNYNYVFDSMPIVNGVNTAQLTFNSLTPGLHTLVVTDAITGCQATATVTISQPTVALDFTATATNINCNNDNATITVTTSGGTPNYKYAVALASGPAPAPSAYGLSNQLVVDTNSGADMNWMVYVMDANGCPVNKPQTIILDVTPTIATAVATQCPSPTGTYAITVTASGFNSALQYSTDGVSYQTSNIITVTAPGTYNVTVRDANGCVSASTSASIAQPLIVTPTVTTLPSCTDGDGVITISTTGGSGNYEYRIDSGVYPMTTPFTGVSSGSHTVYVRDTTTGCEVSTSINLTAATPIIDFALAKTDVTCNGGSNGTITASLATPAAGVNDNPVYMYSLSGAAIRPAQASKIFTGLAAGTYTVTVTSGRGCTLPLTIDVTEPPIITVSQPTVTPFRCTAGNTSNFATITVNSVTGGSGTYTIYEFFKNGTSVQRGANNVYTETNLAGGSYTVTVYDDKGCQGSTATMTINPFTPMDKLNVVVNQAINCRDLENITVTAVDASGVVIAGVQYTLEGKDGMTGAIVYPSQTNATGIFTGLAVGNYIITATNPTTGCILKEVHYVSEPNTFDLTIDNIVDVTCYGGTNGSANVTIVDRNTTDGNQAGPFDYTLVAPNGTSTTGNSATFGPLTLNGLVAGTYTITATLTNSPFCSVTKAFTINGPTAALKISETHTPITCVGNDGTISATAVGGWSGGYEYQLELVSGTVVRAWATSPNFTGLGAGNYVVKVRDSKGCVDATPVNLLIPTPIVATITVDKPVLNCFGDTNATITVQQPVTGGSGSYKYTLEATYSNGTVTLNGPQISNVFTNLGAGSYRVSVSDTWSCSVWTNTIVINQPTVVTANLVKTTGQTCNTGATLTLSATGGTGPYTYSTDPNFGTVLGSFASSVNITVPFTTVPAKYIYYVKDANGCSNAVSNSIDVIPLEPLNFTFEVNNPYINCLGDNNGKITADATGGLGNYVYTLLNGSGTALPFTPTQLTPGHFTQLPAGSYTVQVTSGSDCSISKPITITQPDTALSRTYVVTPVTCNGYGNGKIEITAQGGTGVVKFAISPDLDKFLDSGIFLNLPVGHYQTITQDERGCNFIDEFDITEPAPITASVISSSIQQEYCAGDKTAAFSIVISGGVGPYSISLDDPNGTYVPNQIAFTGLSGGDHTVYIKDSNGCIFELLVTLDKAVTLNPLATVTYDCVNDLPANKVTVTIDPSNNPADVVYYLDSNPISQASNIFLNVTPGQHFVIAEHKNGCVRDTGFFTVDQIDPLAISLDLGGLNEIVATATGGSGVYYYSVNGEDIGTNNKYIYYRSGNYTVTVTDSNGCVASATKYFEFIDIKIPNVFTPNGSGTNDTWEPTNTTNYPDIQFVVYDRYGREVGRFGAGQSWDGKYKGTELPMGDYWYVLKLRNSKDNREFIGHFTLYR